MSEEIRENIKISLQKQIPFWLSLFLILLNYVPSYMGVPNFIRPATGMICVFYWVLYRSDLFNMFIVFLLGTVSDIMSSAPLGSEVIAYLTMYVILNNMRNFFNSKPFVFVWYGFSFIFICAELVKWLLVSVYYAAFLPLSSLFFIILFTIVCYPLVCFINGLVQRYLMNDEVSL